MRRSLSDISPVPSSHKVGLKRVLLATEESGCAITRIAVTDLKAGEVAEAHVHEDMMEGFYVMSGGVGYGAGWRGGALQGGGFCVGEVQNEA